MVSVTVRFVRVVDPVLETVNEYVIVCPICVKACTLADLDSTADVVASSGNVSGARAAVRADRPALGLARRSRGVRDSAVLHVRSGHRVVGRNMSPNGASEAIGLVFGTQLIGERPTIGSATRMFVTVCVPTLVTRKVYVITVPAVR